MKSTARRLAESYCRPKTEEEWIELLGFDQSKHAEFCKYSNSLGAIPSDNIIGRTTEIPVSYFLDLLHDRLAPWRLAEDGFTTLGGSVYSKRFTIDSEDGKTTRKVLVVTDTGRVYLNDGSINVTTYTDLLTLIRLIG
jgi:hypothetical protein